MNEVLQRVMSDGVTTEECARAAAALTGDFARAQQRRARVAVELATHEVLGATWEDYLETPARLQAVTAADVRRVARSVFAPDGLVAVRSRPRRAKRS